MGRYADRSAQTVTDGKFAARGVGARSMRVMRFTASEAKEQAEASAPVVGAAANDPGVSSGVGGAASGVKAASTVLHSGVKPIGKLLPPGGRKVVGQVGGLASTTQSGLGRVGQAAQASESSSAAGDAEAGQIMGFAQETGKQAGVKTMQAGRKHLGQAARSGSRSLTSTVRHTNSRFHRHAVRRSTRVGRPVAPLGRRMVNTTVRIAAGIITRTMAALSALTSSVATPVIFAALVVVAVVAIIAAFIPSWVVTSSTSSPVGVAVPAQYQAAVTRAGTVCPEITSGLIAAQIQAESGWNPHAVSPAGAQGISQFMPGTWATHGLDGNGDGVADPFNAEDSIWSQANYMCELAASVTQLRNDNFISGDVTELTLAAYNAGLGNVLQYGGIPPFAETQHYVASIMANSSGGLGTASGSKVVADAEQLLGIPYLWGGATPAGFDCSGLVQYVLAQSGITVPHSADRQSRGGSPVAQGPGSGIDQSMLAPGDIIGFSDSGGIFFQHVGIYAGSGMMIHSPVPGSIVEVTPLSGGYWMGQYWSVRRY